MAKAKNSKTVPKKSVTKSQQKATPQKTVTKKATAPKAKAETKAATAKSAKTSAFTSAAKVNSKTVTKSPRTSFPQIAPLHHRVVVRPEPRQEKTAGGLYIPDSTEHKPLQGTVVAVGLGKVLKKRAVRPMDVQKGDTVLYAPYAGTDVQLEGEQFLIVTEDEILGIVNA